MSYMKCPFCQQELKYESEVYMCRNPNCKHLLGFGTKELWQELIRTRKALEQSEICCTEWEKQALDYKAENIALSGELERTRKALDVAKDALQRIQFRGSHSKFQVGKDDGTIALKALDKITALEQKDE